MTSIFLFKKKIIFFLKYVNKTLKNCTKQIKIQTYPNIKNNKLTNDYIINDQKNNKHTNNYNNYKINIDMKLTQRK